MTTTGITAAILRAISDPGSVLTRLSGEWGLEPLTEWQTRAVLEAATPQPDRDRLAAAFRANAITEWEDDKGEMLEIAMEDAIAAVFTALGIEPADYSRQVIHLDGDPRNITVENCRIVPAPEGESASG
jgi:hypothetical protein